jgi:putative ABC transport system permease protein
MTGIFHQLLFAARQLWKSPGFTLVAILTLALGIGVNTAIFSVVEAVMLRPLPYPDPERLLSFEETDGQYSSVSPANLADYAQNRSLTGIAHVGDVAMNLTGAGAPERVSGTRVTWNFFDVVGVQPFMGRALLPGDDRFGASPVVILGNEFWRSHFGADPRIVGKSVRLDGQPYQVIGVMPAGFVSPEQFTMDDRLEFYVPACFTPEQLTERGSHDDDAIARLKPGVSLSQARAEFRSISARLAKAYPKEMARYRVDLEPSRERLAQGSRTSLLVLLGAVLVILLLACANVANLLLARSAGQRREIAIRIALGARRSRVMREMLMQTALLALGGCGLGLLAATWIDSLLIHLAPGSIPRLDSAALNLPVLLFAIVICGGTVLLFGVAPAWLASGADPQLALHGSGTRHSAGASLLRLRSLLMAGEIALSLVLLIGAGLMLKSFMLLRGVGLGFQPDRVLTMNITIPEPDVAPRAANVDTSSSAAPPVDPEAVRRLQFFQNLVQRTEAIPGIESAAFGRFPLRGHWSSSYERKEHPIANLDTDSANVIQLDSQMSSLEYFKTLQIPLIEGRTFTADDRIGSEPVIIVNQAFERAYYPRSSALGHSIRRTGAKTWRRIIGVVADAHFYGQDKKTDPAAFLPAAQVDSYPMAISDFAVKSALPVNALLPEIRKAVWSLNPDQPITRIRTLSEHVTRSQATQRFQMTLLLLFGGLALTLAVVGIYGVIAYSVEQRTSEIGIRMALGAQTTSILGMVLRQAVTLAAGGLTVGLAVAWAASKSLTSLLYAVKPVDLATYVSVSLLLVAASIAAAYLPARRASHTDPMNALRHE